MIVKDLVYILTEGVGSIFLLKNQVKRKNYFVASLERKWLNCKDTTKSKPDQNPKRQKKFTKQENSLGNIIDTWLGRGRGWQRQRLRDSLKKADVQHMVNLLHKIVYFQCI